LGSQEQSHHGKKRNASDSAYHNRYQRAAGEGVALVSWCVVHGVGGWTLVEGCGWERRCVLGEPLWGGWVDDGQWGLDGTMVLIR
jgi:hypothetical protein